MSAPMLPAESVRRAAQGRGFERGVAYFRDGAVRRVLWDAGASLLVGEVDGSAGRIYRCTVRVDIDDRSFPVRGSSCTCPMTTGCKHVIAVLLASNAASSSEPAPVPHRKHDAPATPGWRTLLAESAPSAPASAMSLALGVELRLRSRGANPWQARTAVAAVPDDLLDAAATHPHLLLGVRPMMRSDRTGAWIKGDASWDAVRRPGSRFPPAHTRWFAELYSIARDVFRVGAFVDDSEWLTLDSTTSGLLWAHLSAAAGLGIPIISTRKHLEVTLARHSTATVEIGPAGEGLRVSARIRIDGEQVPAAQVRPIGDSGLYRYAVAAGRITVTLAEADLPQPVLALLQTEGAVDVPAGDVDEFFRDAMPRLSQRTEVRAAGGVELPSAVLPEVVLTVVHHPGDRLEYSLAWEYAALGRFPYAEMDPGDGRDAAAESAGRARIAHAWAEATDLPHAASGAFRDVEAAQFATEVIPALRREKVRVEISGVRRRYRELTGDPEVTVSTVESTDPDWFDLGVEVRIDGRRIPFAPLFTAISRGRKKMLLADGGYFSLAHPALQRLRDLVEEAGELSEWETGARISRYQTDLWAEFEDVADEALPAVAWRETAEGLRDADGVEPTPLPTGLDAELRPYQKAGLDWLSFLWRHRLGGVLADDMGLGKTLQMLALIAHARETDERRPFLVIAPTSVTATWQEEAARFTPALRVARIDATRARRFDSIADIAADADVVVTSYTLLRLEETEYSAVAWAGLVLDEAQFVKNPRTRLHRAVRELRAEATFAITGTPLENSLTDLWALLSLAAPGLFPSARRFREEYVGPIEKGKVPENQEGAPYRARRLERLRRRIRPLVLRRTKDAVAGDLPAKQEQRLHVELSPAHRGIYDTVLQRERQKVLGLLEDLDRNRFIVFRSLTLLRLLSLAPGLVDPEYSHIESSKLDPLLAHLTEVAAEGHRVLVFSQFTSYLELVAARLEREGIAYEYLDGSTRDRPRVIDRFRTGSAPVFLISLKAGGFGLTLTEADYVFLLDPWWNPAVEAQAVDRTHRIGQHRTVMVYRMISAETIEEKVMALQERKARLFAAVMDDDALFGQALTADDIRGLLET